MSELQPFAEQGNWTPVHNVVFDEIMPRVSNGALRVLLFVIRNTSGYQRKSCEMTYAQIKAGTAIKSDATIAAAIKELCSPDVFGSPLLATRQAESVGIAPRDGIRYAINRKFSMQFHASKNEACASKNEACHASKNEASSLLKEKKEEEAISSSSSPLPNPHIETRTSLMPPSVTVAPNWEKTTAPTTPPPDGSIIRALCEVCLLDPANPGPTNTKRLPALKAWLLSQMPGEADAVVAQEVRRRFDTSLWTRETAPHLSQIEIEWLRQGQKADAKNKATSTGAAVFDAAATQAMLINPQEMKQRAAMERAQRMAAQ